MELHYFLLEKILKEKEKKNEIQKKKVTLGWVDMSGPGPVSFFIQEFHVLHYADSI